VQRGGKLQRLKDTNRFGRGQFSETLMILQAPPSVSTVDWSFLRYAGTVVLSSLTLTYRLPVFDIPVSPTEYEERYSILLMYVRVDPTFVSI
jgi:hypothetical protein